eukprot:TRINITY_DN23004_c0_g1_i1.p1 TRINITY_DN23004_c0_g1~~TRINITY_DN23004_c0_g1_i1.p1  ORF type:complete len:164 (+),score=33.86 TRINITY_DN23004_c0_g1_i1:113-604(+)
MQLAGAESPTVARSRRERRRRAEARPRLTLVKDGACLAGHRGGPERRDDGNNVAGLLRAETAALKTELQDALKVQFQHVVQEVHVPAPMNREEVIQVPEAMHQDSVQHQDQQSEVQFKIKGERIADESTAAEPVVQETQMPVLWTHEGVSKVVQQTSVQHQRL